MPEAEKSSARRKRFQRITAWLAVLCVTLVFSAASAASVPESGGKILTVADADRTFGNGRRADINGIAVVSLYGTWREMGRQYGMLMKDRLILRIRDNGRYYDLTEQSRMLHPENPAEHIGLRLVFGCADEVRYSHAFRLNNVSVSVSMPAEE